jgi:uncharacterized protein YbaP (TraB family)
MKPKKQSLLWKLTADGIAVPSYVFGTMHVQDRRAFNGIDLIFEKINACDAFAAEFHLDDAAGSFDGTAMLLPHHLTLHDFIPPKKYAKLRQRLLKSAQLDLDLLQRSLPFMAVNMIGGKILQSDMPVSLDEHLWNEASRAGKKLLGIESFQEQMEVLGKIPIEMQVKMLLELGRNLRHYRQHIQRLADLYCSGDLYRLSKTVKKNAKGLRKMMLYHRNEVMAGRIAALARQQSLFAAIGAGHLLGGKGVLRLLKKEGLKVVPVQVKK